VDEYAPLPSADQLRILGDELGFPLRFDHRVIGGLGGTVDVLTDSSDPGKRVVLKRYWVPEPDEVSPAEGEFRALELAAEHGVPAPSPIWVDRIGLFPERAIVISFVEGAVVLHPADPIDWAAQLAAALDSIHGIRTTTADQALFPDFGDDDSHYPGPEALRQHPLGRKLWARRAEAVDSLQAVDPVYVHHDFWSGNTLWIDEVYRELSRRDLPNLRYWELMALCRPMPDIAIWVPAWQSMGVEISADEARLRHTALITAALES
jgi:aminoglycoside phosphotransferase (APT) family kinase protein